MARIAGVNIPTNKRVVIALQYIHGIGPTKAKEIVAKVGIPAGPFRPYGFFGTAYHQSTLTASETIEAATQNFTQHTHGWGMHFGGGAEGWITSKVALFGELSLTKVKGKAEDGGEGFVDDRMRFFGFGVRIRLSR